MSGRRRSPRRPSPERQRRKYSESRDDTRSSRRTSSPRREHRSRRSPTPPARSRTDPVISKPVAAQSTDQPPKVAHQKSEPLSLEELIAKRAAQDEMKKPVFLSKEERAKLALEKRQKEVERLRESRPSFSSLYQQKSSDASFNGKSSADDGSHLDQREITQIKSRYMRLEEQTKPRRQNERRFVFDWENGDDTSADANPLYNQRHHNQMFGRGHIAGIDPKEQMKMKSDYYKRLLDHRRTDAEKERAEELQKLMESKEKRMKFEERNWRDKPLSEMTDRDWRILKEDFNISTKGGNIPRPLRSWEEARISQEIKNTILKLGYNEPTPIQRQAIPIGLLNRDLIGIAQTGSGKTAAFLIPMLDFVQKMPPLNESNAADGPYALILAPTRELAQQIEAETLKFARPLNIICVSIVGGHALEEQSFNLRNGAHIIIATPGRLRDCLDRRILVLNQCTYLVMDEADRMVDMGFEADVDYILDALPVSNTKPDTDDAEHSDKMIVDGLPKYRQTTMFSATMPPAVERIARNFLRRPSIVTIGEVGYAVDTIEQRVEFVNEERKPDKLLELLGGGWEPPMIVFVNQKRNADSVSRSLEKNGFRCTTLHGGKSQDAREVAISQLRNATKDVLVATDVAGRGIDIPNVSLVVNYDMAKNIEDYTHRIGRTGRAGKSGVAISFLTQSDSAVFYDLKQMLARSSLSRCPPELANHEAAQAKPGTVMTKRRQEETLFL